MGGATVGTTLAAFTGALSPFLFFLLRVKGIDVATRGTSVADWCAPLYFACATAQKVTAYIVALIGSPVFADSGGRRGFSGSNLPSRFSKRAFIVLPTALFTGGAALALAVH